MISAMIEPFRFALVGKITCNRSITTNSIIAASLDKAGLSRPFHLQFLPRGFLLIKLSYEEDYERLWSKGSMFIGPLGIRFSKWTPEFDFSAESSIAPVWIRLPELPLHLYNKKSLFSLGKILGNPVKVDDFTADASRGAFARICVEVDVLKPLLKQIWVGWGSHRKMIDVEYEKVPSYCIDCKMIGHDINV